MPFPSLIPGARETREVDTSKRVDLQPLLMKTKFHPKGRVQLDENGEVVGLKPNIIAVREIPIVIETKDGHAVQTGVRHVNVNGGHTRGRHPVTQKQEDCCWRVAFSGPTKYHQKVLLEKEIRHKNQSNEKVAPDLTAEEAEEYFMYVEYLKEKNILMGDDVEFYGWLKKTGAHVEEDLRGFHIVYDKRKVDEATDHQKQQNDGNYEEEASNSSHSPIVAPVRGRPKKS